MEIRVHNRMMEIVGFLSNEAPDDIHFTDESWHQYLETGSSSLEFTIQKTDAIYDIIKFEEATYFSIYEDGQVHVFIIAMVNENETTLKVTAVSNNTELNYEQAPKIENMTSQGILWYLERSFISNYSQIRIGVNEVLDRKRTLKYEGESDTKLARLIDICNSFDAEFEFVTTLAQGGKLKELTLNIYKENDETNQGVGRRRIDLLPLEWLPDIRRNIDYSGMITAVRSTGKDGLTYDSASMTIKNVDGQVEFVKNEGDTFFRAPIAANLFPTQLRMSGSNLNDIYHERKYQTDYETVNELLSHSLRLLRQNAYPKIEFELEMTSAQVKEYGLKIGDTLKLYNDKIKNDDGTPLLLEFRVSELIRLSSACKAVFSNYKKLKSKVPTNVLAMMEKLAAERIPYTLELSTNNGIAFKNGLGSSQIIPTLKRGAEAISGSSFVWYVNGSLSKTSDTFEVLASTVKDTAVVKVEAMVNGKVVASTEVTFTNVSDGTNGLPGKPGADGKTSYWHTAYANSADGKVDFHLTDNAGRRYFGHYTDYTLADSTDPTKYKWVDMAAPAEKIVKEQAVLKTDVKVTDEGIVTSASKTVNGQTIASMIAQRAEWVEIIAQLLKIKADMIVDGAITADKLNVAKLSSIISNLGEITGGSLTLSNHYPKKTFTQVVESNPPTYIQVKIPEHDTIMEIKEQYIRFKGTPSYMPIYATTYSVPNTVINQRGVFWTSSDYQSGLPEGSSSIEYMPVDGRGKTGIKVSSSKNIVLSSLNADIVLKASNYTDWTVSTVNRNVRWKVQGNLVIVDYDVTFSSSGNQAIVTVPTTYIPKAMMFTVKAWRADNTKDRNAQLNADGGLHILGAEANQRYCGQIFWAY